MEILIPILIIAAIASNGVLAVLVIRSSFRNRRARLEREARQARRNQPVVRPPSPLTAADSRNGTQPMSTRHEAKIQAAIEQAKRLPESGSFSELRGELIQSLQGASRLAAEPAAEHIQLASKALIQAQSLFVAKSLALILGQNEHSRSLDRSLRRFARKLQSAIDSFQISKGAFA